MLSEETAHILFWCSFASTVIAILVLFVNLDGYNYYTRKIDKIALFFVSGLAVFSFVIAIYSLISIYYHSETNSYNKVTKAVEEKYDIKITDQQKKDLYDLIYDIDEEEEPLYATGSTIINGKEVIAVWKDDQIFLMEFKNEKLVELPVK